MMITMMIRMRMDDDYTFVMVKITLRDPWLVMMMGMIMDDDCDDGDDNIDG